MKQLGSYVDLIKNLPNLTEIARIIPRLIQIIELVQNQRDLIQLYDDVLFHLHQTSSRFQFWSNHVGFTYSH